MFFSEKVALKFFLSSPSSQHFSRKQPKFCKILLVLYLQDSHFYQVWRLLLSYNFHKKIPYLTCSEKMTSKITLQEIFITDLSGQVWEFGQECFTVIN